MNSVSEWKKILEDENARDMIEHLHEFTYIRNPNRRMTI